MVWHCARSCLLPWAIDYAKTACVHTIMFFMSWRAGEGFGKGGQKDWVFYVCSLDGVVLREECVAWSGGRYRLLGERKRRNRVVTNMIVPNLTRRVGHA